MNIRFVDNQTPLRSKLQKSAKIRKKRQTSTKHPGNLEDKDLFLSSPTTLGNTVLSAIDNFDARASVPQKTSANFAVLKGHHVSECSDSYGTFSSALVKKMDVERKTANAEIRPQNANYHFAYNKAALGICLNQPIFILTLIVSFISRR